MSAILSQRNSLAKELVDKGIELEVIKGAGSEFVRAIRGMEELHGKKFVDLTPEEQDIWRRAATKQSLMTHQSLIARSATMTGDVVGSQQNIDDLAAGENTRPKPPEQPSSPANPDTAIVLDFLKKGDRAGAIKYMQDQERLKASRTGTGSGAKAKKGLDVTERKRIYGTVRNSIVSVIQIPEKIDVNNRFDKTAGILPTDAELNELTRGLVESLDTANTLPSNMLRIIRDIEKEANAGLKILQGESPTPILDRDGNGRIVFHRDTSVEDRVKARQYAAIVAYFDSAQGKGFKEWLVKSANQTAYDPYGPRSVDSGSPDSGQYLPEGAGGEDASPQPQEQKGASQVKTEVPPDSKLGQLLIQDLGFQVGSWITHKPTYSAGHGRWMRSNYAYQIVGIERSGTPGGEASYWVKVLRYHDTGIGGVKTQEISMPIEEVKGFTATSMPSAVQKELEGRDQAEAAKPETQEVVPPTPPPDVSKSHW